MNCLQEVINTGLCGNGKELLVNHSSNLDNATDLHSCVQDSEPDGVNLIRPALLDADLPVAVTYISVLSVALCLGASGNLLIIVGSFSHCINKVGKEFIVNLAIADFCVSGIADPMCILGAVKGEAFFNNKQEFCTAIASMCLTACFCAFFSLTMITINRYVFLCHNEWYDRIYSFPTRVALCLGCWVLAFLCEFPNFVDWGGHYFDGKSNQCIWDRTASYSYSLFVAIGLIGTPLLFMGICYVLIFVYIWNSKKSLYKFDKGFAGTKNRTWSETVKSCRMIFIIFVFFVVCWMPYAVVIVYDAEDNLSSEVHLFVTLLAHLHSSANCVIYMICNRKFRRFVLRNLGLSKCTQRSSDSKTKVTLSDSLPKDVRAISIIDKMSDIK